MAATMTLVVVLWMTEAIPLAVTALIGPGVAVALQIAPVRQAYAPFADPIIFLVLGGFVIARAMLVHGVDRRVVYRALAIPGLGSSALRVLIVYGALCVAISMWVSNTATTAMMFPIGLSVVAHMRQSEHAQPAEVYRFAMAMMLLTAFAASIGGMGTPVGTATNLIGIGMLDRMAGARVTFADWTHPGDADGRDPVRGAHPALSIRGRFGPDVGGQCRVRAPRTGAHGADDEGAAERVCGVRVDRRVVGRAGCDRSVRRRRDGIRADVRGVGAGIGGGDPRRGAAVRAAGGLAIRARSR